MHKELECSRGIGIFVDKITFRVKADLFRLIVAGIENGILFMYSERSSNMYKGETTGHV